MKKNAFTLAEVLITLGIIGVVAALVMPGLIVKVEKLITVIKVRKTINVLSNALQRAYVENGLNAFDKPASNSTQFFYYIAPYLNISKACINVATAGKCGMDVITCAHGRDTGCTSFPASNPRIVLNDGTIVSWRDEGVSYYNFIFDVNGSKGKNKLCHDVWSGLFYVYDSAKGNYRVSIPDYNPVGNGICTGNGNGVYGLGDLVNSGWKINWR